MARIRVIPPNVNLYVGPSPATGSHTTGNIKQLHRLQSWNWDWSYPKENISVFGQAAPLGRDALNPPTVNMSFSYYLADFENESSLGFVVDGSTSSLANIIAQTADDKNYFALVTADGVDAITKGGADGKVIGYGNGTISSYSVQGAVGSRPTVTINVAALNAVTYADGVAKNIPAVDPTTGSRVAGQTFTLPSGSVRPSKPNALRPGDITVDLSSANPLFMNITGICVQSFQINYDLSREDIQCLGSRFARARLPQFPINVNFQVEALKIDIATGDLADFICQTGTYEASVTLRDPSCTGNGSVAAKYTLKNMTLEGQSESLSIGQSQTITMNWVGQISASGDVINGLFMSGISSR